MASSLIRRAYKRSYEAETVSMPVNEQEIGRFDSVVETLDRESVAYHHMLQPIYSERNPSMRADLLHLQLGAAANDNTQHFLYSSYTGVPSIARHTPTMLRAEEALKYDDNVLAQRNVAVLAGKLETDYFPKEGAQKFLDRDVVGNSLLLISRLLVSRRLLTRDLDSEGFAVDTAIKATTLARKIYLQDGLEPTDRILVAIDPPSPPEITVLQPTFASDYDPIPNEAATTLQTSLDDTVERFRGALLELSNVESLYRTSVDSQVPLTANLRDWTVEIDRLTRKDKEYRERIQAQLIKVQDFTNLLDSLQRGRRASSLQEMQETRNSLSTATDTINKLISEQRINEVELKKAEAAKEDAVKVAVIQQSKTRQLLAQYNQMLLQVAGPAALQSLIAHDINRAVAARGTEEGAAVIPHLTSMFISKSWSRLVTLLAVSNKIGGDNTSEAKVGDTVALVLEMELKAAEFIGRSQNAAKQRKREATIAAQRVNSLRRSIAEEHRAALQQLASGALLPFALSNDFALPLEASNYFTVV